MGGLLWLWMQYRKQSVAISRIVLIGMVVVNLFVVIGIYSVVTSL